MLEMENIGKKIASLRKAGNWTQQDLADQLGVTYQAVSNWERGLSIPDVVRLKDLARLFEVSLDELMGNEAAVRVVEVASGDRPAGTVRELLDSAPYMKPQALEKELRARTRSNDEEAFLRPDAAPAASSNPQDPAASSVREEGRPAGPPKEADRWPDPSAPWGAHPDEREQPLTGEADEPGSYETDHPGQGEPQGMRSRPLSFGEILAFAPFVSSELISELVRQEMDQDPDFDYGLLTPLAPFLGMQHLKELTLHFLHGSPDGAVISEQTLMSLLPHLDQSTLTELARHVMLNAGGSSRLLIQLAPFLDEKTLGRLVLASDKRSPLPDNTILKLAPFLDSGDLKILAEERDPLSRPLRTSLMPFLHGDDMEAVVRDSFTRKDPRDEDPQK